MSAAALIGGQASLFAPVKRPELRAYQATDVAKILACLQRGRNPLYALPTGGGKSVVLAAVCDALAAMGWQVWIFAHRRELIRQMSQHLSSVGLDHGIIAPDHPLTDDLIQVCSIDTVRSRLDSLRDRMKRVRLMIIDEAHHATSASYALALLGCCNALHMGCTATPYRYDGKPLGDMFNEAVRGPSPAELERLGYLAPVRIFAPGKSLDLSKVKKRMGDFVVAQLEKVVDTPEMTQAAIYAYALHAGGLPTIAYCTTVKHATNCAEAFTKAGWSVDLIEGEMKTTARDRAIAGLASGRHQLLFSVDCVSEGTDIPIVAAGLLLRPTGSTGLNLQQGGRTRRLYPGKDHSVLIDMVGNWSRHGMPNADRQWSLSEPVKGLERAVNAVRRCGNCHYVSERGPERCAVCNRKYPAPRPLAPGQVAVSAAKVASLPGLNGLSPEQVRTTPLKALLPLAREYEDLVTIQKIKGYKASWVSLAAAEKGLRPKVFASAVPAPRSRRWG